jgi:hypothetical protein
MLLDIHGSVLCLERDLALQKLLRLAAAPVFIDNACGSHFHVNDLWNIFQVG